MSFNPKKQLAQFLAEDIGKGDITSALLSKKIISVNIISREKAILAGSKYAKEIFALKGCKSKIITKDGVTIKPNQTIMKVTGNADKILTCERTALNIITRMSGIATQTNELVKKIPKKTKLYATRKTAPGLRYFDKEAVEIGGGKKHRLRLDEMVMIKDNHIAVEQSLLSLIKKTKKKYKKLKNIDMKLENLISKLNRQFLHAKTLGFVHPKTNEEMIFSSILPQELNNLLKMLRNTNE